MITYRSTSDEEGSYLSLGCKAAPALFLEGMSQTRHTIPTFVVEDALHLHATSRVGDTQGAAGDQAFRGRGPVCGPHQTPVRLVVGPLQHFHSLATADGQFRAVAGGEVVDDHCQLAAARELGRERDTSVSSGHGTRCG